MKDKKYFSNLLPKRPENSNKGTFGSVLNIAGSDFYTGAAYFSSVATMKVGCGKVTLASEEPVLHTIASLTPNVILMPLKNLSGKSIQNFQAISIGCGLTQSKKAVKLFKTVLKLLNKINIPLVIDADGLNILSTIKNTVLPPSAILTPHPKEMSRLLNVDVEKILDNPNFYVKDCSRKYNCITVLKLHETLVADNNGNFYENNTGNSSLAHGGSGDVLCGMITGFIAQGVIPFDASCLAVYLHGLTGEFASKDMTEYSVLASDLLDYIPKAIKSII